MFIYFWETEAEQQKRGRERDTHTQNPKQAPGVSTEPDAGPELTNHEIVSRAEVGRLTDWATQALLSLFYLKTRKQLRQEAGWQSA